MDEGSEVGELSEAAKRGLQRAGVHMVKAALEVIAGLGAFLDEVNAARRDDDKPDDEREHITLD